MLQRTQALQRTRGRAALAVRPAPNGARIARLHQAGSAKIMWPRTHGPAEAVVLNTAGGLTGGDRFDVTLDLAPGARLTATTQTAERAYESPGDAARVDIRAAVGEGAHLSWLPQETILFDGSHLERRTTIDLAPGATCLALEMLVIGRAAMKEEVRRLSLLDRRTITRGGVPLWMDPLRLTPEALDHPAMLDGAKAIATLVMIGGAVREITHPTADGVAVHQSAWDDKLVIRAAAPDLWPLRQTLLPILDTLTHGALPRVWQR
ncbi:MAG: urease accessory protein UreD [Shimia sp.]